MATNFFPPFTATDKGSVWAPTAHVLRGGKTHTGSALGNMSIGKSFPWRLVLEQHSSFVFLPEGFLCFFFFSPPSTEVF